MALYRPIHTAFQTMVAIDRYCDDNCPNDEWLAGFVHFAEHSSQPLRAAGVQVEK